LYGNPERFGRAGNPVPAVWSSENRRALATASKLRDAPYLTTLNRLMIAGFLTEFAMPESSEQAA
jgi:hypothetical protein